MLPVLNGVAATQADPPTSQRGLGRGGRLYQPPNHLDDPGGEFRHRQKLENAVALRLTEPNDPALEGTAQNDVGDDPVTPSLNADARQSSELTALKKLSKLARALSTPVPVTLSGWVMRYFDGA